MVRHDVSQEESRRLVEERVAAATKTGKWMVMVCSFDDNGNRKFSWNTCDFPTSDFLRVIAELTVELSGEAERLSEVDRLRAEKPGPLPPAVFATPPLDISEEVVPTAKDVFKMPPHPVDGNGPRGEDPPSNEEQ